VRRRKKVGTTAMKYFYVGPVEFVSWQGDQPIEVLWRVLSPLPQPLLRRLR
jgi:hypothetical protein